MPIFDRLKGLFGGGSTDESQTVDSEMTSCEEALRLVHEYLDGELDAVPQRRVKEHFDKCQKCYPHLHLESAFRDAVRRAAAGETAPPELKARLVELLAEAESQG